MAYQVLVDELSVTMQLGNNGVVLQVRDTGGKLRGYLKINKAYIDWYKGKERTARKRLALDDFITDAEQ